VIGTVIGVPALVTLAYSQVSERSMTSVSCAGSSSDELSTVS
jgi:hypothetical protein